MAAGSRRMLLLVVFAALLLLLAAGIWGTVLRPAAYEVRGTLVARPAPDLILVRHDAIEALGMGPMELMAIVADPAQLDRASLHPGDRLRLAVRQREDRIVLLRVEKLR